MTSTRQATNRSAPLVVLAALSAGLLAPLYLVAVQTAFGQRVDEAALFGRTRDAAVQHAVGRALDTVSVSSLAIATIALALLALFRQRPQLAAGIAVLVVGANVTTQVLKDVLDRPDLAPDAARAAVASYPSGHTTVAMSLALALVLAVPARLRLPVGLVGISYAVVVATATVTGGWHRPSDVIGGYLVTLAWAAGVCAWLVSARASPAVPARVTVSAEVLDRVVILVALFVGAAAVVMGVDVLRDACLGAIEVGRAYTVAVVAIVVGAVFTLGALLVALGRTELDTPPRAGRVG